METLPVNVLLGINVQELNQLLRGKAVGESWGDAMVVMTRARAQQQREMESVLAEKEEESGVLPSPVESIGEDSEQEVINRGSIFDDDIFVLGKEKPRLTRGDKRKRCRQYWQFKEQDEERASTPVRELSPAELKDLQEQDEMLVNIRRDTDKSENLNFTIVMVSYIEGGHHQAETMKRWKSSS